MTAADHRAYRDREWTVQPDAEAVLADLLAEILAENPMLQAWSHRLLEAAAVRLRDIVDHVRLPSAKIAPLRAAGWQHDPDEAGDQSQDDTYTIRLTRPIEDGKTVDVAILTDGLADVANIRDGNGVLLS